MNAFLSAFTQAIGTTIVLMVVVHLCAGALLAVAQLADEMRVDRWIRKAWHHWRRIRRRISP